MSETCIACGLAETVARVRELHGKTHWCTHEDESHDVFSPDSDAYSPWPCPTSKAIDEKEASNGE